MTTISSFIEQAWNDHVDDLAGVVKRLDDGLPLLAESPGQLGGFLLLAEHLHLVHHGDSDAMQEVLDKTESLLAVQADAQPAADRARLAMRLLREEKVPAPGLPLPATIRAHGSAASGFASRGEPAKARRLLQSAASLARDADADIRTDTKKALAACYNNTATLLLDGPRSPQADALMLEAAALSRSTWAEVGTWLNAERAEYVLAQCAAATGDGDRAAEHAQTCLAICETNAADAFERFFAHEAMARARLARGEHEAAAGEALRMQALLADIPDEGNREYAAATLAKLERQPPA